MNLEQLVLEARSLRLDNVGEESLHTVAELALAIAQERTRRLGGILTPVLSRPYPELGESEREGLRQMAEDVTKALVLLGWVDLPGA